jgi:site-specific DNA recombinase
MAVPPLIPEDEFHEVQRLLRARSPAMMAPRAVGGNTLLTGICFCAACGGAMVLRTGTSSAGRSYRYYTCSTKARQGPSGCKGMSVRMEWLEDAAVAFLLSELLDPERLEPMMAPLLVHRDAWADRRRAHVIELRSRATDAETKLRRLYDAVESGVLVAADRMFRERVAELGAIRDQAEADAERIAGMVDRTGPTVTALDLHRMAADARTKLHSAEGGARRALVRSLLQRVEVADKHRARVLSSREAFLKALAFASGTKLARAGFGGSGELDDRYDFPLPL